MVKKKVIVTGGAGYIGSILCRELISAGFEVTVLDRFFFGDNFGQLDGLTKLMMDSRNFDPEVLSGTFAVLDLAAISNDPAGELNKQKTLDINFRARRRLQELCVEYGVSRYILASSCSVYGFQNDIVDENSKVNPLTTYAEANLLAEKSAFDLLGGPTTFTAFRQATIFGLSPRMRFDLVVNAMSLNVSRNQSLRILRDGNQWRPLIHVRDTTKAFIKCLDVASDAIDGEIINIGANSHNFRVMDIAQEISDALGKDLRIEWYGDPDERSYKVDFTKAARILNFTPDWTISDAAIEISAALDSGNLELSPKTNTLDWYKELARMDEALGSLHYSTSII